SGSDLVAERLADLGDAEGNLLARGGLDVLEVDEDSLSGLGAEKHDVSGILYRPHEGLEHEVELPRLGELPAALRAAITAHVVGPKALLARLAVDQRIGEALDVTGRFPHSWMHEDGTVDADDVGTCLRHLSPPRFLHIALQLDADGA